MGFFEFDLLATLAGFGFSLLILWSGVGAGVLVIPTMVSGFGVEPVVAIASGSVFAFTAKIAMTLSHARGGSIDWQACRRFLSWCLPVTLATSTTMAWLSIDNKLPILDLSLIICILLAGVLSLASMLIKGWGRIISRAPISSLSVTTGLLMGLTGVGGGILVVPALTTSGGLPIKIAVATSIPIGLVLSLAVSLTLGVGGFIAWDIVISMLIGCALALPIGTRLFSRFPDSLTRRIICTLIAIALIDLSFEAVRIYDEMPI
jgi:uncharacterized membrane protein YfcA